MVFLLSYMLCVVVFVYVMTRWFKWFKTYEESNCYVRSEHEAQMFGEGVLSLLWPLSLVVFAFQALVRLARKHRIKSSEPVDELQ